MKTEAHYISSGTRLQTMRRPFGFKNELYRQRTLPTVHTQCS
jgi:hypothetical protein